MKKSSDVGQQADRNRAYSSKVPCRTSHRVCPGTVFFFFLSLSAASNGDDAMPIQNTYRFGSIPGQQIVLPVPGEVFSFRLRPNVEQPMHFSAQLSPKPLGMFTFDEAISQVRFSLTKMTLVISPLP